MPVVREGNRRAVISQCCETRRGPAGALERVAVTTDVREILADVIMSRAVSDHNRRHGFAERKLISHICLRHDNRARREWAPASGQASP